jgi:hypothetical protein
VGVESHGFPVTKSSPLKKTTVPGGEDPVVGRSTRGLWQSRGWYGGGAAGAVRTVRVDGCYELPMGC